MSERTTFNFDWRFQTTARPSVQPPERAPVVKFCGDCRAQFVAKSWNSIRCQSCQAAARDRSAERSILKRKSKLRKRFKSH